MTPAEQLCAWADKLRDLSAMGLMYAANPYDQANYRTVQEIALHLQALATATPLEVLEPLRAPVFARPTPFASGDAAVINPAGEILLIRRADNGLWAMPGGALEVGETPAEGVAREALEETGVPCRARALVGVFDSRYCGTVSRHHLYHFVFLCEPTAGPPEAATHAQEVLETQWFSEAELPAALDPGHRSRLPEAFRVWRGDARPFWDGG